jgi:hypothetical protein
MRFSKSKKWIFVCLMPLLLAGKLADLNDKPVDMVYPHLDSANSRWFFFSSACRPFGMVNLSPDNQVGGCMGKWLPIQYRYG